MKSIVLHDYFESAEGGGRLSFELACGLGADLGYGFKADRHPCFETDRFTGREYQVSVSTKIPVWRQFLLTRAFRNRTDFIRNYDTAIYSGFYTPLAITHHKASQNIYYCHTPPRYIYDQRDFFFSLIPKWQQPLLTAFNSYFRPRYEQAVRKMDVIVTNSTNVQKRISRYLGLSSTVVHPPCNLDTFTWQQPEGFFLSMARLDPLKRVDVIVEAFKKMPDKRLIVVSGGTELDRIRQLAEGSDNIDIRGWVTEEVLHRLLATCLATIYIPKDEDFGMSPVESMAAGKPVIGVAEGGLLETVVQGETGMLIPADAMTPEMLCQAVEALSRVKAIEMRDACNQQAALFSRDIFLKKMRHNIENI
jgi:glycosyltransferase involved in cell wall biosynthesis